MTFISTIPPSPTPPIPHLPHESPTCLPPTYHTQSQLPPPPTHISPTPHHPHHPHPGLSPTYRPPSAHHPPTIRPKTRLAERAAVRRAAGHLREDLLLRALGLVVPHGLAGRGEGRGKRRGGVVGWGWVGLGWVGWGWVGLGGVGWGWVGLGGVGWGGGGGWG